MTEPEFESPGEPERSGGHVHADEAQVLEWALSDEHPECGRCAAAVLEARAFLDACREGSLAARGGASAPPAPPAPPGFVERVLARTTREDLGWRGDLRLVGGFVRTRLRSSRLLRFAAASLLLHLLVLPVFAWMALREAAREPVLQIRIAPAPVQALPVVPIEPEPVVEGLGPLPEPVLVEGSPALPPAQASGLVPQDPPAPDPWGLRADVTASDAARTARIVLRDRDFLAGADAPLDFAGESVRPADAHAWSRWLVARGEALAGNPSAVPPSASSAPSASGGPSAPQSADAALERALRAEWLLDRWLGEQALTPALAHTLGELGAEQGAAPGLGFSAADRRLELFSLQRARAYGLLDAAGSARLGRLEAEVGALPVRAGESPWATWSRGLEAALSARGGAARDAAGGWASWQR